MHSLLFANILILIIHILGKNIYNWIEKIYYINLDHRTDRKYAIEKQLNMYFQDKNIERITGVKKEDIYKKENKKYWKMNIKNDSQIKLMRQNEKAVISCYISHVKTLTKIAIEKRRRHNDEVIVIVEDDCVFDQSFIDLLKSDAFLENIPEVWNILKPTWGKKNKNDKINKIFYNVTKAKDRSWQFYYGNHFLLYNARKIVHILEKISKHSVGNIDIIINKNVDNIYAFDGDCYQKQPKGSHSDIWFPKN